LRDLADENITITLDFNEGGSTAGKGSAQVSKEGNEQEKVNKTVREWADGNVGDVQRFTEYKFVVSPCKISTILCLIAK